MITAPSNSFYMIQANGEAAELIISAFSEGVMADVVNVTVLSKEFTNDIEPIHELDFSIEALKESLGPNELTERIRFNPLFMPMSKDDLEQVFDSESKPDAIRFAGMDGNPYIVKRVEISSPLEELINGSVLYHSFELPAYEVIMKNQNSFMAS